MANDPPFALMHERLQASANVQPMTVSCLLCPEWEGKKDVPAHEARAAAEAHRLEVHPERKTSKVVRRRRSFSSSMTAEREAQIEEERRQRMRAMGIA